MRKEYRRQKAIRKFFNYMTTTWKNKLGAIFMFICGMLGVWVLNDATALVILMLFAVPMFFSSKDWFY